MKSFKLILSSVYHHMNVVILCYGIIATPCPKLYHTDLPMSLHIETKVDNDHISEH